MTRVVAVTLRAQVAEYNANMLKAAQATRTVGTEAEKLAQQRQSFELLGRAMLTAGGLMAAGVGVAVKKFADFDQAMSNVAATGQDARDSLDQLRQAAIDAGARTVFSATESANAIEEMAKAGVDAADILGGGLDGALDLAAAGGLGVADAAGIAATALKVFGLQGKDMSHVADLLAAGAGKAMGDVTDLSAALAQGGQVAAATGLSIEETTAALSAFASQGLLGSDAGTSLKTMLQRLTPQSKEAEAQFDALGVSAYDANGQFVGLANFAGQLQTAMQDMTPEARNAAMAVMFGSDAVRAANVLFQEGESGIRKWTAAVDDQGYAAETARTRLDNLKGDVEALGGAFDSALITMGSGANGPLREVVQGITDLVDSFNGLPDWAQQSALGVAALGGAALLAGGAFFTAVPKIAEFNAAMATMPGNVQRASRALGILAKGIGLAAGAAASYALIAQGVEAANEAIFKTSDVARNLAATNKTLQESFDGLVHSGASWQAVADNSDDVLNRLGDLDNFFTYIGALDETGRSAVGLAKTLQALSPELASMPLDEGQAQFRAYAEELGASDQQMLNMLENMPEFKAALLSAADAQGVAKDDAGLLKLALGETVPVTNDNTDAMRELAGQAQLTGDEVEDLGKQILAFGSATLDTREAQRGFEAALDDLSESIKDNGKTLDIRTEKGRSNQAAIDDLAKSTYDYAAAIYEETGSQEEANKVIATGRERLVDMLGQFGITGKKAQEYADSLGLIPDNVYTAARLETDTAQRKINQLISDNNGRRITLNVVTNETTVRFPNGNVATSRATGGAIMGPGTATSDSIPAMLSNGEHVLTAADVAAMGGQQGVYAWRAALHAGGPKKFATGGGVSYKINPSELRDWRTAMRRGEPRTDGRSGNGLKLVDQLFSIAADIGGRYGQELNRQALRSEKQYRTLERQADSAADRLDKATDKLKGLKDAASSMASRVASAVRSFFDLGKLATTKTVTTGTSSSKVVNGIVVSGAGATTTTVDATTAGGIASSMSKTASRIRAFADKLSKLAAKKVNPKLLEELALLGVENGEPIADALLKASASEITSINKSYADIDKYSNQAGKTVADQNFAKLISEAQKQRDAAKRNADSIKKKLESETTRIIKVITDGLVKGTQPVKTGKKKAAGGPIYGPGTSTSDDIPAWLSNGENVWSAADVDAWGGQGNVERLKRLTPTLPRFANGGPVASGPVAFTGDLGPAVIDEQSMRMLAGHVASAILQVRSADARDAVMAAARGVRS